MTISHHRECHVAIVSSKADLATDSVVLRLHGRGVQVARLNTEDYPFFCHLSTEMVDEEVTTRWSATDRRPTALWFRRVRSSQPHESASEGVMDFCRTESYYHLLGASMTCGAPRVMSDPAAIWRAENKLVQLAAAKGVGLRVPDTLVSNDVQAIRDHFHRVGREMICKPVRTGYYESSGREYAIFTSQVLEEHLCQLEQSLPCPSIFQRLIPKQCDVRVTMVGDRVFVAEIDSQEHESSRVDWRATHNPELPHREADLPGPVLFALRRLLHVLGVKFAAIDLIKDVQGEYCFLEVNPNGQWLWLEDRLGMDISGAVADWLIGD